MAVSTTERVLTALTDRLRAVPKAKVERNTAAPERIPKGGLIVLRDGDPGEPEQALGGVGNVYYSHAVEIEVYVETGEAAARDAAFDALVVAIGAALDADPTLDATTVVRQSRHPAERIGRQPRRLVHTQRLLAWSELADLLGRPLPRPALRFTEVFPRHPLGHGIARRRAPLACLPRGLGSGQVEPHVRSDVILRDASTNVVHDPEVELRLVETLLGS